MKAKDSGTEVGQPDMTNEFSQLARVGKNSPWRYIAALPLVLVVWALITGVFSVLPGALAAGDGNPDTYVNERTLEVVGYPIVEFASLTLGFLGIWFGLFIAVRYIHKRPFLTLVNASGRVNWRRLGQGFALYLTLIAVHLVVAYLAEPQNFKPVIEPGRLLIFVPVVLALIPIQAAAEELLSRGYLLQLSGLATSNVFVLSLVTGILFALPHLGNPEAGENTWIYFADTLIFGFVMGLVTLKDAGLELAVGAHIANNVLLFPLINFDETLLDTPSVFKVLDSTTRYSDLASTGIISVAFYLLVFKVFKRKNPVEPIGSSPKGIG